MNVPQPPLADEDPADGRRLQAMYRHRFDDAARSRVDVFWDVLFREFLGTEVAGAAAVLDLGAGSCDFINRVRAPRRIAVDLNPDTVTRAAPGVEVVSASSTDMSVLADGSVDLIFTSNFFEHLSGAQELQETLDECHRLLSPVGRIVILMPNFRAVGPAYCDYLDHSLLLTDRSLVEALGLHGFSVDRVIPRFVPYGDNPAGRIGSSGAGSTRGGSDRRFGVLLTTYLRVPAFWRVFGGQMYVTATRVSPAP